jgi:hypothetical protein
MSTEDHPVLVEHRRRERTMTNGHRLLVEYGNSDDVDFGEIIDVESLTADQMRDILRQWVDPKMINLNEEYHFIIRRGEETFLTHIAYDFKVVDVKGKVVDQM